MRPRCYQSLVARLAADEPRATMALAALLRVRNPRREARLLTAGPGERSMCVVTRLEPAVWGAFPVLADPADAPALAAAIDRSVALSVEGPDRDVEPLQPHLRRFLGAFSLRRLVVPWQRVEWPAPDPSVRLASVLDVAALADLYDGYEIRFGRTRSGQRRLIEAAVRRGYAVVAEGLDRLDGATLGTPTPGYIEWSELTVRPEARGHGISHALMARVIAIHLAVGLGCVAVIADTNPMTLPEELGTVDGTTHIDLRLPDRVRGERRLRKLYYKVQPTRHRRS